MWRREFPSLEWWIPTAGSEHECNTFRSHCGPICCVHSLYHQLYVSYENVLSEKVIKMSCQDEFSQHSETLDVDLTYKLGSPLLKRL